MDYKKLNDRIIQCYGTRKEFAKEIGYSKRSMSLRLNSKIGFTQAEIIKIAEILDIKPNEINDYFFRLDKAEVEHNIAEKSLEELAKPLMQYLKANCHPYTSIVITEERIAVLETVLSIPENVEVDLNESCKNIEKSDKERLEKNILEFIERTISEPLPENAALSLPAMIHELRELLKD